MIEREHVNVVIEASMIYLDDSPQYYHHREGTRIAIKWARSGIPNHVIVRPDALSEIEFDDRIGVLNTWREALFGAERGMVDTVISPRDSINGGRLLNAGLEWSKVDIMLASVNQFVFDVINEAVVTFMTIKIDESAVTKYVERKKR
jgi:hypothetical protein